MSTPICDFVKEYIKSRPNRMHMPGHKGISALGFEPLDITETDGADDLFHPHENGIIAQSEKNASDIFGCTTMYSTQGSTLCIQAMLYLIKMNDIRHNKETKILAGRNAHKAFINAAALIGIEPEWIFPNSGSYHSCNITAKELENQIKEKKPTAVYLTSPDYLGNVLDIYEISAVCKKYGVILTVDSAHGAYLKFLPNPKHPIDLGADICCSSAHKTLSVITGGAYLHISDNAPSFFADNAKNAFSLFGSSSPSYLILQSLDAMNDKISAFCDKLYSALPEISNFKEQLIQNGFELVGDEALKITIAAKKYGYTGNQIAEILKADNIYPEFYDKDFIVFMLSPFQTDNIYKLVKALICIERKSEIISKPPDIYMPKKAVPPHCAIFSKCETLPLGECVGRICAAFSIGCPPAIPPIICGEYIDEKVMEILRYYEIANISVIVQE